MKKIIIITILFLSYLIIISNVFATDNSDLCRTFRSTYSDKEECRNACSRDYRSGTDQRRRCDSLCERCMPEAKENYKNFYQKRPVPSGNWRGW